MTEPKPKLAEQWHINRGVQISHLFTTMAVAFSVIWYAGKLEQRVALVEQTIVAQRERDMVQDSAAAQAYLQTQKQLERIDAKLDRLIELRVAKP